MKVFTDPTTGDPIREDGQPGYRCARCGNTYATPAALDVTVHACPAHEHDLDVLNTSHGLFADGYTATDIATLATDLTSVQIFCAWQYRDAFGFAGDSEIVGRTLNPDATTGPWCELNNAIVEHLHDDNPATTTTTLNVDEIVTTTPYFDQDLTNNPTAVRYNVALRDLRP